MPETPKIAIREAAGSDAAGIAEVQVAAWKSAYRGMLPDAALDAANVAERTERWVEILADYPRATFLASVDGEVIGWCGFGESRDDDRLEGTAEVYGLYVHPRMWRSGAGALLWQATCERLKTNGCGSVDVWVLEANERARRFYEAVGCLLDEGAAKMFEGDGYTVPEVRYSLTL